MCLSYIQTKTCSWAPLFPERRKNNSSPHLSHIENRIVQHGRHPINNSYPTVDYLYSLSIACASFGFPLIKGLKRKEWDRITAANALARVLDWSVPRRIKMIDLAIAPTALWQIGSIIHDAFTMTRIKPNTYSVGSIEVQYPVSH